MKLEIDLTPAQVDVIVKRQAAANRKAVTDREIIIGGDDRRALEAVFKTTIADGPELVKRVRSLSDVKVGGVEISFSPDELARLDMQATFHGRTREVFIREMAREIKDRMLENI